MKAGITLFLVTVLMCLGVDCIFMRMNDGINKLVMNSSLVSNVFTLSLTSYGSHNSSFYLQSQLLSSDSVRHRVTHSRDSQKLIFDPPIKEQMILFNQYDQNQKHADSGNGQFWFTLKHPFNPQESKFHFATITVSEQRRSHRFILPAFRQPFSFLPAKSFYRCEQLLLSISEIDHYLDVSVFTEDLRSKSWKVNEKWDWSMRNVVQSVSYGRFIRFDKDQVISISTVDGKSCNFVYRELPKIQNHQQILRNSFYKINDILKQAVTLQAHKKIQQL